MGDDYDALTQAIKAGEPRVSVLEKAKKALTSKTLFDYAILATKVRLLPPSGVWTELPYTGAAH